MKFCCSTCVVSFLAGGIVAGGLIASGGFAQQPGEKKPAPAAPAKPDAQPGKPGEAPAGMPPVQGPGPEQAILHQFDGKWNGRLETFGTMAGVSTGTMTNSWELDGMWMRQEWVGDFMGMPFKGLSYWGYDRPAKKWVGTWIDIMGTGVTLSKGDYDAAKKTWTFDTASTDHLTGKDSHGKETITIKSDNEHVMEMWGDHDHDGKDELMMRITYTRAK